MRVFHGNAWPLGSRKQSCGQSRWCPMWTRVSLKVPLSPVLLPSGNSWDSADMLKPPGNLCSKQPLHQNTQFFFLLLLFLSHTVLQFYMQEQLLSPWLQLNCLHKSFWKYLEENTSHLGLFWAKWCELWIGCSWSSFWKAADENVLENWIEIIIIIISFSIDSINTCQKCWYLSVISML